MKNTFLLLVILMTFSQLFSQEDNRRILDEKSGKEMLIGTATRDGLVGMGDWFAEEYSQYKPDSLILDGIKKYSNDFPFLFIVMGTWCSDSREQVPHMFKMLDQLNYPEDHIFMVAVNREKKADTFCIADYDILLVPTFIFTKDGDETGRIVETPVTTIEQDMLNILNGNSVSN